MRDSLFAATKEIRFSGVVALLVAVALPAMGQDAPTWAEIGALFEENCTICHSGDGAPLGLRLDTLEHALDGSENGPVIIPQDAVASELVKRLTGESQPQMPLTGPPFLEASQIAMVERWIEAGMPSSDSAEAGTEPEQTPLRPEEPVTFAHVEPIFLQRCAKCHKVDGIIGPPPEELRLDSYAHIIEGGERLAVLPGSPGLSEVVRRIEGKSKPRMPLDGPPWLGEQDIRLIRQWIEEGAPDAQGNPAPVPVGGEVRYRGRLTGEREIDGAAFIVDSDTRIDERPRLGERAEVRGVVDPDGRVRATRLHRR